MTINKKIIKYLYHVIAPLFFASLIYIFFRPIKLLLLTKLLYFLNFNPNYYVKFDNNNIFASFFLYNLTDALWAYSLTSFVAINLINDKLNIKIIYLLTTFILIYAQELLQGKLLPGTFDLIDILFLTVGFLSSIFMFKERHS